MNRIAFSPGTYFLKIQSGNDHSDDGYDNIGDYRISVAKVNEIDPPVLSTSHPTDSGEVAFDTDQWYKLEVTKGGTYSFLIPVLTQSYCSLNAELYASTNLISNIAYGEYGSHEYPILFSCYLNPGVYYLNCWNYSGPCRYQIHVLDFGFEWFQYYDTPLTGEMVSTGDTRWYAFRIDADAYTIGIQNGTLAGQTATLYGPNDMTAQSAQMTTTGKGRATKITKYLKNGLYFVKVQGTPTGGMGTYTIQLKKTYHDLTLNQKPPDTSNLAAGGMDGYSFIADYSGSYTIETSGGTLPGAILRLYGPNDNTQFLAKDDRSGENGMPKIVTTLSPGRYFLTLQGRQATDSGSYSIQVRQTYTWLTADNSRTTATIRYRGDAAYYALCYYGSSSAQKFTIVTKAGTLKHNFLRLYGPNSETTLLAQNGQADARGLARITTWLEQGKTYYLKIQGLSAADVGDCQLQIAPTYEPLRINDPQTTKTLGYAGEVKYYQFQVETGASYSIETEKAGAAGVTGTFLRLYGPGTDTKYLGCNTGAGAMGRLEKVLQPGNYYLTAQARSATETGAFLLRVRNTITTLTLNAPATTGLIADRNDVDWYAFHIAAEADYVVESRAGTLGDDYLALYGPGSTSTPLALGDNYAGQNMGRLAMRLKPGDYTVGVRGCHPASDLGTYTIQVHTPILPVAVNGAPVLGAIDFPTESDWYSFTVTATTTYRVETYAGTMSDTYMRLYGPGDTTKLIGWNGTYGPGQMGKVVMTLKPGTYYAQVRAGHNGVLGTYQFLVRADSVIPLTLNAPEMTSGYIAPAGDIDWYSFTVTEEGAYEVYTRLWSTTDLFIRLYGPDDKTTLIDQYRLTGWYDDQLGWRYAHLKPGTYTLRVQGYAPNATMPYEVGVSLWR